MTFVRDDLEIGYNNDLSTCSCGLSGLISGEPPAFTGVRGAVEIWNNDPDGACWSPAAVLADPCELPAFALSAEATSPTTVAPGGAVSFAYTVTNNSGDPAAGALWFTASPGGASGVIRSGTLSDGQTVSGSYTQRIPASAPPGVYTYTLNIGRYPDVIVATVPFTLRITRLARDAGAPEGWAVADATPWPDAGMPTVAAVLPAVTALHAAAPNPAAGRTTLAFDLAEAGAVRLAVYDLLGRAVAVLVDEQREAGTHVVAFDTAGLPSGTYLVRLKAGGAVQARRVTLVR